MPLPPPRLGSTTDLPVPGGRGRRRLAVNTALADAVGAWSSCCVSATAASTDTQRGHNRRSIQDNIFAALQLQQTTAPSSPVAVTDSSEHSSPHAHSKSQISQRAGAGGDGTKRVVESLSGGVETQRHYSPLPTSLSALLSCPPLCCCVLYISRTHTRIPHASRQPCLYHAVGRSCDHIHIRQSARHHPPELRPGCLSHQSIIAEMYLILPAPMRRKVCHVSVREDQRPTAR
jgi:hypothetical protein